MERGCSPGLLAYNRSMPHRGSSDSRAEEEKQMRASVWLLALFLILALLAWPHSLYACPL